MQRFEGAQTPPERPHALGVWWACATLLIGPSLLVWIVRLTALGMGCAPASFACKGVAIGGGFRDTLELAWLIGSNSYASLAIAFAAAIAALRLRRPAMAGLSLIVLPSAALVLPTFAVYSALYSGCDANEAGVGNCELCGAGMGMSFHHAAMAPWIVYGLVPYSFTLALMIGVIGFLFFRPLPGMPRGPLSRPRFDQAAKSFDDARN